MHLIGIVFIVVFDETLQQSVKMLSVASHSSLRLTYPPMSSEATIV